MNIEACFIELSSECNLNCIHCYNRGFVQDILALDSSDIIKGIDHLREFGLKMVALSGGEPLMYEKLNFVIDKIRENGVEVLLLTNGTIPIEGIISENNIRNISFLISLDGVSASTSVKVRGCETLSDVESNVRYLQQTKAKAVTLKMTISRFNIHEIDDFFVYCTNHDVIPSFGIVSRLGNASTEWLDIGLDIDSYCRAISQINYLYNEYRLPYRLSYSNFTCPIADESNPLNILIRFDGQIQPCQLLYNDEFSIGNITRTPAIQKELVQNIKEIAKRKSKAKFVGCNKCISSQLCARGCIADAFNITGSVDRADGLCQLRRIDTKNIILGE